MKRLSRIFLTLVLSLFTLTGFSQNANIGGITYGPGSPKPPSVVKEKESSLRVTSSPSGASVYLDGVYKGSTPLTIENIEGGYHNVKLVKEHYKDEVERVYIPKNSRKSLHARLIQISGYLRLYSEPSGASITVNGSSYIQGSLLELDEGYYTVKARKFGYEDASRTVYVSRWVTSTQTIVLDKAAFRLGSISANRSKFNPFAQASLSSVKITTHVNAPAEGRMTVSYADGEEVFSRDISFTTWTENFYWTGTDYNGNMVGDGLYKIEIQAEGQRTSCLVTVDSNLVYPSLSLTNGGSGIGSVASADSFPEDSSFFELDAGLIFGNSFKDIYQIPLSLGFLWSPSQCFELGLAFRPYLSGEDSVINFSSSIKITFQTELSDSAAFCWGFLWRIGFATGPLYLPYGIDAGNGTAFGGVLGFKTKDLYVGGEASFIINPTSGLFTQSDDRMWKAGLALQKSFDAGSLGIFAGMNLTNGEYFCKIEEDGSETVVQGGFENHLIWEVGFESSWYILSSPVQAVFKGSTYIKPQDSRPVLIYPHAQIGLKFLL